MTQRIHIIPINDCGLLHVAGMDCWCFPVDGKDGIATHNAKDCREARERITGNCSSDGWHLVMESERA